MSILATLPIKASPRGESIPLTTPEAVSAAADWISTKRDLQSAEAGEEITSGVLVPLCRAEWIARNAGRNKPVGSVEVHTPDGSVLASFSAVWSAAGGVDLLPPHLRRERFTIRLNSDLIPAEAQAAFVAELMALAARHGAADAVTATGCVAPVRTFNEVRHRELSPEQNAAVEAAGLGTRVSLRIR